MSRDVIAVMRFWGEPGREREAAEAWAFELKYYFMRRVGEQPQVTYEDGMYVVLGLMTTSHPGDSAVTHFTPVFHLDSSDSVRRKYLMELYDGPRWG